MNANFRSSTSARTASNVVIALVAALGCLSLASPSLAQPALERGFGGPNDFGTSCLSWNDDGTSQAISLAEAFPDGLNFFGTVHRTMYVNTNGNITFSGPVATFTPSAFPLTRTMPTPMIAPYWADIDIRGESATGCEHSSTDGNDWGEGECMLTPGDDNGVYWHLEPGRAVMTWDRAGYFNCNDDRKMTFQLILTTPDACTDPGDFDVEFRYTTCEWATGYASMGTGGFGEGAAQVGFDAANGRDFVQLPESRTGTIHTTVCSSSNVGVTGVWRFQIRAGTVVCPGAGMICDTGDPGVCAEGRTQCLGGGVDCVPVVASSAERCDGVDNDCDGDTDEETVTEPICAMGSVCRAGTCVNLCFEGACAAGYECDPAGNLCVEEGCVGVMCAEGERCSRGVCGGACAGVVCPAGQDCASGRCVDLCEGQTCDDCTVCEHGDCVDRCSATSCPAGQACDTDGRCIDAGCLGVTCDPGTVCREGACADACDGARCPVGEVCMDGACMTPPPVPDAGMPDAGAPDAFVFEGDAGTDSGPGPILADTGTTCGRRCQMEMERARQGCACSAPARTTPSPLGLFAGLAIAIGALARRRR